MKSILICDKNLISDNPGGSYISLRCLLSLLKENCKESIQIDVLQDSPVNYSYSWVNNVMQVKCFKLPHLNSLSKYLYIKKWEYDLQRFLSSQQKGYDLIIAQNEPAFAAISIGRSFKIPTIFFVRSLDVLGYEDASGNINYTLKDYIKYPVFLMKYYISKKMLSQAELLISNSIFVKQELERVYRVKSKIVYPPINSDEVSSNQRRNAYYLTFVNPRTYNKGVDIFLEIARKLPEEKLLVAGKVYSGFLETEIKKLPNVKLLGNCDNMKEVYAKTKILLIPTRINEPFGRVAAEAMMNGIPCVASAKGGLPEVVGNTGFLINNPEDTDEWVAAIQEVKKALANNKINISLIKQQASQFSHLKQYKVFETLLFEQLNGNN